MNLVTYLMKSRGPVNTMRRLPKIVGRFGVSSARMERALNDYVEITAKYNCTPTLAVTSVLLERHPEIFRRFEGAELAVHGFVHTDYKVLDGPTQAEHMERSLAAFRNVGLSPRGFRCPYLRWNDASFTVARDYGLTWASNRSMSWNVVDRSKVKGDAWAAYQKGLELYGAVPAANEVSLPKLLHGVLDIPASLPDDEAMLDRLELGPEARAGTWMKLLDLVYERGEAMTLILHHERVGLCRGALESVLRHARSLSPSVWVATLGEVTDWWLRRRRVVLEVVGEPGAYAVSGNFDDDMMMAVRGDPRGDAWYGDWRLTPAGRSATSFKEPPVVVVSPDSPSALHSFLRDEGYVVRPSGAGLKLPAFENFTDADKRPLVDFIETSDFPLARLWRWPNGARAALSITGDVDAMSLVDFLKRPLEV